MIEITANAAAQRAIKIAHEERARAARNAWAWLFYPSRR